MADCIAIYIWANLPTDLTALPCSYVHHDLFTGVKLWITIHLPCVCATQVLANNINMDPEQNTHQNLLNQVKILMQEEDRMN